ncbi:AB hydrolase superfamily protein B1A11.02 [Trametes pubescens]|uniref:AB hydrolase superfamily protein B1A11.02 n=1 Tax=Trametes pubescens TaxID=154538 RepID=A0A1M2VWU2_TRAPU|nr:AB hydrolase superfamily protein B1A11.02 [Trametes pubescens]
MASNHLATPDAELAPILATLPTPDETLLNDFTASRAIFSAAMAGANSGQVPFLPPADACTTKDHKVPVKGGEIVVRSYVPASSKDDTRFPLLFWTHGGGWVVGDIETDDNYLKILSVELQLIIVSVEYRLAPEHPFPTGLNDSYTALNWTTQNAGSLNADLSKGFLVGGASAGGNLAAVLAHRAKADLIFDQFPLTGQILLYPVMVHPDVVPDEYKEKFTAYEQMNDVNTRFMRESFKLLQGPAANPEVSPLLYLAFEGLPPALVHVCGMDPLRDDGLLYAEKLKKAGVPTKLNV